jgi:hypothetical protein
MYGGPRQGSGLTVQSIILGVYHLIRFEIIGNASALVL